MCGGGLWWSLYQSSWFLVSSVRIVGNHIVSTDAIGKIAAVQEGIPLASVPTRDIAASLSELPQIGSVRVERGWPHTVLITVVERIPVAVASHNGKFTSVDSSGVEASPPRATPEKGLTVIEGKPGSLAMKAAVTVLQALPSAWKVTGVVAPTRDSVTVTLKDETSITFGSEENVDRKVAVAVALMANKYLTINVSAPDAPTVRK
jgi:cell division protein FtsQ